MPRWVVAAALSALAALIALALVGCGDDGSAASAPTSTAQPVAANATPKQIVEVYLEAVEAGDLASVRSLTTPEFFDQMAGALNSWYGQRISFEDVVIGTPRSAEGSGTAADFAQAIYVPVDFTLTQEHPVSMPNGPTVWGFLLGRDRPGDPWLIDDHGT